MVYTHDSKSCVARREGSSPSSGTKNFDIIGNMSEEEIISNSVFLIEVDKISPNPYQPRKTFDERALASLAESIRQYGILQPLVVCRKEEEREDGSFRAGYELIAGERRLRAAKLAGISQVPVVIRAGKDSEKVKLEIAIIENLQREDLNPVDRARAFQQLSDEFGYKPAEISRKIGMSREYVANSIRILRLPEHMLEALKERKITEGHTRPLLMLAERPAEMEVLFKDISKGGVSVRDAERIARRIAVEKVRRHDYVDPEVRVAEERLADKLGTKVLIEGRANSDGGRILINFKSKEDLMAIIVALDNDVSRDTTENVEPVPEIEKYPEPDDAELYSVSNFSL